MMCRNLSCFPQPEVLNLSENRITDVGFVHITPHLLPSLLELDISVNSISTRGITALSTFLRRTDCRLRKVCVQFAMLALLSLTATAMLGVAA